MVYRTAKSEKTRGFFNNGGTCERGFGQLAELQRHLRTYISDFSVVFKTLKSDVNKQASSYANGLFQTKNRNIEKVSEQAPDVQYHQLHHFITYSPWDDAAVDKRIMKRASEKFQGNGPVGLVLDPTGMPKKGKDSVGVTRQWIGNQGKVDNGQVAVTAALVNGRDTCLIDKALYLPKDWVADDQRCEKAGIPLADRVYRSHQQLVVEMIKRIDAQGVAYDWIGMDAEFGNPALLNGLDDQGKQFLVDVKRTLKVYPRSPKIRMRTKGRSGSLKKLSYTTKSVAVENLIDGRRWKRIQIRDTTKGPLTAEIQQRVVWLKDSRTGKTHPYHLIVRRDRGKEQVRTKYSLSNAPLDMSLEALSYMQAQRFWVEHAIKECKQQAGMSDYQVRRWRAWHHHFSMVMLIGLFLMEERLRFRDELPLLTAGDIWTFLFQLLTRKTDTRSGQLEMIQTRYRKREQGIQRHYLKE